jgi:hypothetical protein
MQALGRGKEMEGNAGAIRDVIYRFIVDHANHAKNCDTAPP